MDQSSATEGTQGSIDQDEKRLLQRFPLDQDRSFRCVFCFDDGRELLADLVNLSYEGFSARFQRGFAMAPGDIAKATIFYYKLPLYSGEVRAVHRSGDIVGFELLMSYHYLSSPHFDAFISTLFEEDLRTHPLTK